MKLNGGNVFKFMCYDFGEGAVDARLVEP